MVKVPQEVGPRSPTEVGSYLRSSGLQHSEQWQHQDCPGASGSSQNLLFGPNRQWAQACNMCCLFGLKYAEIRTTITEIEFTQVIRTLGSSKTFFIGASQFWTVIVKLNILGNPREIMPRWELKTSDKELLRPNLLSLLGGDFECCNIVNPGCGWPARVHGQLHTTPMQE